MVKHVHLHSGFLVTYPNREIALKGAQTLIGHLLYRGENRPLRGLSDQFGDVAFETWAGKVTVAKEIQSPKYVVTFPMSTHPDGYDFTDDLAAFVVKDAGRISAGGLGRSLHAMGDLALQTALKKQLGGGSAGPIFKTP